MKGRINMGDIEKLHAFNNIRTYLSTEDQNFILKKLGLNLENNPQRLEGLKKEHEFCLILDFLEGCKHILAFDEGVSRLTKSKTPDMLVELANEEKFFIEIKTTEKGILELKKGKEKRFIKQREFSQSFGFSLYLAVKIGEFWALYHEDDFKTEISLPDQLSNKLFEEKFGSHFYIFPKGIRVESEYSKQETGINGIKDKKYGGLILYRFFFEDNLIFESKKGINEELTRYSAILEKLHDIMAAQSYEVKELQNGNTIVIESLIEDTGVYDYHLFLAPIMHTYNDFGLMYDSTSLFKNYLETKNRWITKTMIINVIEFLSNKKVPIMQAENVKLFINDDNEICYEAILKR